MTLALVPALKPKPKPGRLPRVGIWVKISVTLIVSGLVALGASIFIGVRWYNNLETLQSTGSGPPASLSMAAGSSHVIDELVETKPGYKYLVNVRHVSVQLTTNTAGATVEVETCAASDQWSATGGGASCTSAAPVPFRARAIDLSAERILVVVRPTRPGKVVVAGVQIAYSEGIRHASQHLGPTVTISAHS
jgi:hypothetical protein